MVSVSKRVYSVQVRELVEFVLRRGDLGGQGVFVAPGRALAGTRGHQWVQKSRPDGYQKEVPIYYDMEESEFILRIQGRIDGLMDAPEEVALEEIKTVQHSWDGYADPLHWAQAKFYGFIYAHNHALQKIALRLTYLNLESGELTEFRDLFLIADLSSFFEKTTAIYLEWIGERHRWCEERDGSIERLEFPFPCYREGQRELAVAAYRALARGGRLFVEAATGIGKTMSVLFPALKALGEGKLERVFYLTARTMGRAVAEKAFSDLEQAGLCLRRVTLTAKEKLCVREGVRCDRSTCPFAIGYYDRVKPAMREALHYGGITRPALEEVATKHQVCPFELSLDVSSWVDAIVCDYNYVFDPKVYLRRHFGEEARDYGFLVDEAHNLPDRAREMFSAELRSEEVGDVQRVIQEALPRCAKMLRRLTLALRNLCGPHSGLADSAQSTKASGELGLVVSGPLGSNPQVGHKPEWEPKRTREEGVYTSPELPAQLMPLLEGALKEAEVWLAQNQPAVFREELLQLYFRLHSFRRIAELYDERYVTILQPDSGQVRLFCLDPSYLLRQALERGKAAIFFSATLTPIDYYRSLIGGSPEDPLLQLPSPFAPENLAVLVQDRVRTEWKARRETLGEVAQAIGALVEGRRGNYLVYFPSYQYLSDVRERFERGYPSVRMLAQHTGMTEGERETFLGAFSSEHDETLVGFAVMGGIFGEGIDLAGERLIGEVIVGVGLSQLCVERDLIRDYFQAKTGAGFDYAYTFPGMNRVLQAVGRVIRSERDRGIALLIDTRFAEPRYRRLFPEWWKPQLVRTDMGIGEAVRHFWHPRAAKGAITAR